MTPPIQTDSNGFIVPKPLAGWDIQSQSPQRILLDIKVLDLYPGAQTGFSQTIQIELYPSLCSELAAALARVANGSLEEQYPPLIPL